MRVSTTIIDLQLRHTFTIARESKDISQAVVVELEHEGLTGLGEACPSRYYQETAAVVAETLEGLRGWLRDRSPLVYRRFLDEAAEKLDTQRGALSALDLAVFDWVGKKLGLPLYRLLGVNPADSPQTSFTIGINSAGTSMFSDTCAI